MKILACDTSTLLGSVAINDGEILLASRSIQRAGSHSDTLIGMINECLIEAQLNLNDIDFFVSGLGPGSFTGIRISLNTIKTLAYAQNKPCAGMNSLWTLAEQSRNISESITVMINAFKNMVYIAEFAVENKKLIEIKPPQVLRVQAMKNFLNLKSIVLGDGFLAYEKYLLEDLNLKILRPPNPLDYPMATTLCQLFALKDLKEFTDRKFHWSNLLPIYLRASEAEENLKGILYEPLAVR